METHRRNRSASTGPMMKGLWMQDVPEIDIFYAVLLKPSAQNLPVRLKLA